MYSEKISALPISLEKKNGLTNLCEQLIENQKENLISIMIYGSATRTDFRESSSNINVLVIMSKIDILTLRNSLDIFSFGRKNNISPFLLTLEELSTSLDVFPGKILSMREDRVVISGKDVLEGIEILPEHLRLKCEEEIKSVLLKLRRNFIARNGSFLSAILSDLARELREVLRIMVYISSGKFFPREQILEIAGGKYDFNPKAIIDSLNLRNSDNEISSVEVEKLYGNFMDIVGCLAKKADRLLVS
ncbi:MAG: hypothetical protein HQM08_23470 [Candidatus Riflebacteria bacterium]|nr:hypothetical protein [Candidatus Riflebacteria bacterium]